MMQKNNIIDFLLFTKSLIFFVYLLTSIIYFCLNRQHLYLLQLPRGGISGDVYIV